MYDIIRLKGRDVMKGRVKWWCQVEGYGFVEYDDEENVFVHLNNEDKEIYHIDENQKIEFTIDVVDNSVFLSNLKLIEE